MNIGLTLANGAARDAESRWRDHKRDCPSCSAAQRRRQPEDMCAHGATLYADRQETASDLAEERRLARMPPPPGQETLW